MFPESPTTKPRFDALDLMKRTLPFVSDVGVTYIRVVSVTFLLVMAISDVPAMIVAFPMVAFDEDWTLADPEEELFPEAIIKPDVVS